MVLPPQPVEITFEAFLEELPPKLHELARELKAFTRIRKIQSPAQLMQVVMLYCGLDHALRGVAGDFTLWEERITDTAIKNRLKACGPWLKVVLKRMLPEARERPEQMRILVVGWLFAARAWGQGYGFPSAFDVGFGNDDASSDASHFFQDRRKPVSVYV